ncbi:MAG: histidine kinase [Bacteroidota bacterium]
MVRIYAFLFLFFFVLIASIACGQTELFFANQLTLEDNLTSQSYNRHIRLTNSGHIWISSINGLNKFDGKSIEQYLPNKEKENWIQESNILTNFYEDANGFMWFGTNKNLYKYDPQNDAFEQKKLQWKRSSLEGDFYILFFDDSTQILWIRNDNFLYLFDIQRDTIIAKTKKFPLNVRCQLLNVSSDEKILILNSRSGFQIVHLNQMGGVMKRKRYLENYTVYTVSPAGKDKLLLATNKGLLLWDKTMETFQNVQKEKITHVTNLVALQENGYLLSTKNNHLYRYNLIENGIDKIGLYTSKDKLISQIPIDRISLLKDGTVWLSTANDGIFYTDISTKKFQTIFQEENRLMKKQNIRSIGEDSQRHLWLLTQNGVIEAEPSVEQSFSIINTYSNQIFGNAPYDLTVDKDDNVWIGTQRGLFVKTKNSLDFKQVNFRNDEYRKVPPVSKITQTQLGQLFVTTHRGIFTVDDSLQLTKTNLLLDNQMGFTWVLEYPDEQILIVNEKNRRFIVFKKNGNEYEVHQELKFDDFIEDIQPKIKNGDFWIASTNELFELKYQKGSYQLFKSPIEKPISIRGLLTTDDKNLWLSSTEGIWAYNSTNGKMNKYGRTHGIFTTEFNFWSSFKTSSGQFCFGTVNGLVTFNPSKIQLDSTPVRPTITSILINDTPPKEKLICDQTEAANTTMLQSITQPYDNNTLSFRFAALDYTDPSANQFKYRITPAETEWVHSGTENFARYANLTPGQYTFEIDATNSDGVWSNNPAQLDITILPPWYQTWWFRTLVFLGAVGIVYVIYRSRVKQIQKEADFRQKEAEYKQLAAETETAVLRLQMNPHFIFNSMNSISSYLLQKDVATANDYLGRFARLMRKILMVAEEPYLSLYEEIELLEQYMQAEAMRFEEKFHYQFEVAEDIDTDEVLIPTMILQPFVENAIWHGLSNKQGQGRINIGFTIQNEQLICRIADNGVGRQAARKHKAETHESKAITITQRRLNLLATEHQLSFQPSLTINDLVDDRKQSTGTKVVLILPLI